MNDAAPVRRELHQRADVLARRDDRRADPRLLDRLDLDRPGAAGPGCRLTIASPVGVVDLVLDRRRGGDEVEVELALEALLDDLHVEEAEEPAAEPETERDRALGLDR